jgi:hypothetical protein
MQLPAGLALILLLCACGCGRPDSGPGETKTATTTTAAASSEPVAPADPVDLAPLRQAFASAGPAFQVYVDEAVAVVRARAYADAIEQLQKLDRNPKLTAAQRQAVRDVITKLQPLAAGQRR